MDIQNDNVLPAFFACQNVSNENRVNVSVQLRFHQGQDKLYWVCMLPVLARLQLAYRSQVC